MSSSARRARTRRPLCLLAALSVGFGGTTSAFAQQPAPAQPRAPRPATQQPAPAAPAPAQPPAAAAQPNAGPTVVQVKSEPSQADWTKVCGKDPGNNAEICYTTRDFVSDQGQPVLAAAVYDVKGQQAAKIVRFLMPLGLLLRPGIRFAVDQGQPIAGAYQLCFPNGCFAEAQVKDDTLAAFKKGTALNVSVQNQVGREVTFAVPLAGFGKAFDGPAVDPEVLKKQQEELQKELEKRSDELRKRLEQSGGQGGVPGAPGATPPTAPVAGAAPKP